MKCRYGIDSITASAGKRAVDKAPGAKKKREDRQRKEANRLIDILSSSPGRHGPSKRENSKTSRKAVSHFFWLTLLGLG